MTKPYCYIPKDPEWKTSSPAITTVYSSPTPYATEPLYKVVHQVENKVARHYFEAHVTIEPIFDDRLELAKSLAEIFTFRIADLLMKKREQDTEERSKSDTFMTGHGKDLDDIEDRLSKLVKSLKLAGFKVWRYKIEDTLLDSRFEDELGLGVGSTNKLNLV